MREGRESSRKTGSEHETERERKGGANGERTRKEGGEGKTVRKCEGDETMEGGSKGGRDGDEI
eukprot:363302-Chlamydomonas_euryale.AAC.8